MEKKFSIIIPMYNSEKYIKRCIESVINQTYKNIEIILVNDGSTDNTFNLCEDIRRKDSRVILINKENAGVSAARNEGLNIAKGEYIFFLDSDDWIELNSIELLNKIVIQNESDLVIYNTPRKISEELYIKEKKDLNKILPDLITTELINAPWGKLYKNSLIRENNIRFSEDINIAEDFLFNIKYFININSMYLCDNNIYNFDKSNGESLSRRYNPQKYNQLMIINNKISKLLSEYNDVKLINSQKYIRLKNIISCCLDLFDYRCQYTKKEKEEIIKRYKKEHPKILIKKLGFTRYILGIAYTLLPSRILYYVFKLANNAIRKRWLNKSKSIKKKNKII